MFMKNAKDQVFIYSIHTNRLQSYKISNKWTRGKRITMKLWLSAQNTFQVNFVKVYLSNYNKLPQSCLCTYFPGYLGRSGTLFRPVLKRKVYLKKKKKKDGSEVTEEREEKAYWEVYGKGRHVQEEAVNQDTILTLPFLQLIS